MHISILKYIHSGSGVFELSKLMTFVEFFCLTRSLELVAVRLSLSENSFQAQGALSTYVETASMFGNSQLDKCRDLKRWGTVAVLPQPRFITPPSLISLDLVGDYHVNDEDMSEDKDHHIKDEDEALYEHYIKSSNKHFPNVIVMLHERQNDYSFHHDNKEKQPLSNEEEQEVANTLTLVATAIHLFGHETLIMVCDILLLLLVFNFSIYFSACTIVV
jgi:hypothetical protein